MKLIAITLPEFFRDEPEAVCRLLDAGWARVHIRKPGATTSEVAELIKAIPAYYRSQLSLHDHFELAGPMGVGGLHLNRRNPVLPPRWSGVVSRSCHTVDEVESGSASDYVMLSPVFDSISKPGYKSRFSPSSLSRQGLSLEHLCALGGVTAARLPQLVRAGFGWAAMLSQAWTPQAPMFAHMLENMTESTILQFITHTDFGLEKVLRGGCRWVQLRIKDVDDAAFTEVARRVVPMCHTYGATVIFDDRVNLVEALGADGVHVGKNDMPVAEARALLGPSKIIGATANTASDLMAASVAGADYVGLGPFRFTTTKKRLAPLLGIDGYADIISRCRAEGLSIPVVAIGGITVDDVPRLKHTGVDGVAVSGTVLNSPDPEKTTFQILSSWKNS